MKFLSVMSRLFAFAAAMMVLSFGTAEAQEAMVLPVDPAPLVIDTGSKDASFSIEVADDASERSRGLMFRKQMDGDRGMLFVFQKQQPIAFWMKNTVLPLDLVFIDQAGMVQAVLPGTPYSEAPISPGVPVQFVLELNQGTAVQLGIDAGDKVQHPQIRSAGAVQ